MSWATQLFLYMFTCENQITINIKEGMCKKPFEDLSTWYEHFTSFWCELPRFVNLIWALDFILMWAPAFSICLQKFVIHV